MFVACLLSVLGVLCTLFNFNLHPCKEVIMLPNLEMIKLWLKEIG
jgi:hypothetical protein